MATEIRTETPAARSAAFRALMRIGKGGYSNTEVTLSLGGGELMDKDRALYTALVYGVTERRITLDWLITRFGSRDADSLDPAVLTLLRLGMYQIFFTDRIPDHAAVYETVELSKKTAKKASGYVNAVLRSALRGRDSIEWPDEGEDRSFALSVRHSLPIWLVDIWLSDYPDHAAALMEYANSVPPIGVMTNTLRISRERLIEKLSGIGIAAEAPDDAPRCLLLGGAAYSDIEPMSGLMRVQDKASQLACEALGAEPGERILDACAAPGGKSVYSAVRMENRGEIISCDLHEKKLGLISSAAEKLGITIIKTRPLDARRYEPSLGAFDRVLCDVPCSGLGAIAKKPEIRYKETKDIEALPKTQLSILESCSGYLKPGGRLVYSTCTVNRAENDDIARRFTEKHGDFEFCLEKTLFPDTDGCDGFYYAIWKRKG